MDFIGKTNRKIKVVRIHVEMSGLKEPCQTMCEDTCGNDQGRI